MAATFNKYGMVWPVGYDELSIEFTMIKRAPVEKKAQHYLAAHRILWPEDKQHRWFKLGITRIVENKVTVFLGPASSNKTYIFAVHALIDFFCFPQTSFSLISSTEKRSLEIKVWGRVKTLFNRAKRQRDWLGGFVLESHMAITPDEVDDDGETARELNRGIVCVPCVSGGRFVGMGKFQGAKQPDSPGKHDGILKHYGDEAAVMQPSFLDAYSNWMVNSGFKGVMGGNPTDISDPLCTAAEPEEGWEAWVDTEKTQEWRSRWYQAWVVAFDGRDTPNNDEPKNSFPFLIGPDFVEMTKQTHGADSWQYYQQAIGKPSKGMVSNRVITIGLCVRNRAFDAPLWRDSSFIDIYACDPAYGGGDRCVVGPIRIGYELGNVQILSVGTPEIVPINVRSGIEPEDQIAEFMKMRMDQLNIPAQNGFYDSFGRGTLGFSFAKLFGANCPVPVDSGARPTTRPVRFDLYVEDRNAPNGKRLKRCDEHYSKFVTEMWFSTREAIESQQVRNLPRIVANEGQLRMFRVVAGNKVEVEPKDEMKERIKISPDLYDWFAIAVEGARQRGFKIQRIGQEIEQKRKPDGLDKLIQDHREMTQRRQLQRS